MDPKSFAAYGLTVLGFLAGIAAIFVVIRRGKQAAADPRWKPVLMGGMAVACMGVGGYGPAFLGDYAKFLKELASLRGPEKEAAYERLVDDMASGKMPEGYRPLVEAYMMEHPTKDLPQVVERAAEGAKPERKVELQRFRADLDRKAKVAELAVEGASAELPASAPDAGRVLEVLDTGSLRALEAKPAAELTRLKVDPATLDSLLRGRGSP